MQEKLLPLSDIYKKAASCVEFNKVFPILTCTSFIVTKHVGPEQALFQSYIPWDITQVTHFLYRLSCQVELGRYTYILHMF